MKRSSCCSFFTSPSKGYNGPNKEQEPRDVVKTTSPFVIEIRRVVESAQLSMGSSLAVHLLCLTRDGFKLNNIAAGNVL